MKPLEISLGLLYIIPKICWFPMIVVNVETITMDYILLPPNYMAL
jgi:hypothetical protein